MKINFKKQNKIKNSTRNPISMYQFMIEMYKKKIK